MEEIRVTSSLNTWPIGFDNSEGEDTANGHLFVGKAKMLLSYTALNIQKFKNKCRITTKKDTL